MSTSWRSNYRLVRNIKSSNAEFHTQNFEDIYSGLELEESSSRHKTCGQ